MRVKKPFNGTIEEASAEVKRLEAAGFQPTIQLTIECEMGDYTRCRERATKTGGRPRKPRVAKSAGEPAADGVEIVN